MRVVVEIASTQLSDGRWRQGADVEADGDRAVGGRPSPGTTRRALTAGARSALVTDAARQPGEGPGAVETRVQRWDRDARGRTEIRRRPDGCRGEPLMFRGTPAASSPLGRSRILSIRRTERVHIEWHVGGHPRSARGAAARPERPAAAGAGERDRTRRPRPARQWPRISSSRRSRPVTTSSS